MSVLLVAGGGAIGAVCRYLVGHAMTTWFGPSVWSTFAVNVIGSFLIGVIMYAGLSKVLSNADFRIFAVVGVLGGFTTFSSFSFDTLRLLEGGAYGRAALYAVGSVVLGLAAATAGMMVGRNL